MKYAYFTGCVAKGTCPELHHSTVKLAKVLGIDLWEMTDATCCGAGVIRDENPELQIALNAMTGVLKHAGNGFANLKLTERGGNNRKPRHTSFILLCLEKRNSCRTPYVQWQACVESLHPSHASPGIPALQG